MKTAHRGADVLAQSLVNAGTNTIFTLSGNHIMSVFDAVQETNLRLVHTRHEGAAVHMADAWARLTGQIGVAMVTGGQGHGNAVGALCTSRAAESPMLLLSGHAPVKELGRGAFQETPQADMAAPLCKASWMVKSAADLPTDIARAFRIAQSGRPGPVHLSLPSDILDDALPDATITALPAQSFQTEPTPISAGGARLLATLVAEANQPIIIVPPALGTDHHRRLRGRLEEKLQAPVICMESPRGINDPSLGAFAGILGRADLVVLLAKPLDFTLRFGEVVASHCEWAVIDPAPDLLQRAKTELGAQLVFSALAGATDTAAALIDTSIDQPPRAEWLKDVRTALRRRASAPTSLNSATLCEAVAAQLRGHEDAVFISDGGEIGQWAQACNETPTRLINGVAGAIGPSLPYAVAASVARPGARIAAVMGDGTAGFHLTEFDTAMRAGGRFVAVIGNDARWNAEYQIQLRSYGADRTLGCTLREATRYDLAAQAFGAHGEFVTCLEELEPALTRAFACGKPACVNVLIEGLPAPTVNLTD